MSSSSSGSREEAERAFKQAFAALVDQGVPPNVAAARALAQVSAGSGGSGGGGGSKPAVAASGGDESGSGGGGSSGSTTASSTVSSEADGGASMTTTGAVAGGGSGAAAAVAMEEEEGEEGDGMAVEEEEAEPLTVEELRARVAAAVAAGTYAPVADWLREGFSSFPTLDRSFLLLPPSSSSSSAPAAAPKEEEQEGDGGAMAVEGEEKKNKEEGEGLGLLDLEAVAAFYAAVAEAEEGRCKARAAATAAAGGMEEEDEEDEEDGLLAAVRQGQALLAEHLHAENQALLAAAARSKPGEAERRSPPRRALRPYVILLDNPELADPSYHHPVAQHLFAALVLLPSEDKDRLRDWIAASDNDDNGAVDAARFGRWLAAVQQYISIRVLEEQSDRSFKDVRNAVRVLAVLYLADQRRHWALAPPSEFYSSAVNEELEREREEEEEEEEEDEADRQRRNFLHLFYEFDKWRADRARLQRLRRENRVQELRAFEPRSLVFYPFVLTPAVKAKLLQLDAREQMRSEIEDEMRSAVLSGSNTIRPYLVLRVDREDIVNSAIHCLAMYENYDLKKKLRVQFVNEEGVDEGGVQKEFYQVLLRKMFSREYGMFLPSSEEGEGGAGLLYFNPDTFNGPEEFELIGVLLGVAVHNSIILDLHFPLVVYKKLMGAPVGIDDLEELQPAVARSMRGMLDPTKFSDGDLEALDQRFELSYECFGALKTVELIPNGAGIPVTRANVRQYVDCYVDWVLTASVAAPFDAFKRGFMKVCGGDALRLFQPHELELLLCGNPVLDFHELERVTLYEDGLDAQSPLVKHFWEVLHAFTEEEKRLFLAFLTGSSRAPINGLGSLQFVISPNGDDSDRLPTAHTCFTHLLLPRYASKEKLEDRLRVAIHQSEGFGLR